MKFDKKLVIIRIPDSQFVCEIRILILNICVGNKLRTTRAERGEKHTCSHLTAVGEYFCLTFGVF